jgi:carbamoylphosphate synthase large subunit
VSTDFDTADRLYFEPLTPEDVRGVIETEKPYGVVVAFGGQTAIKLTKSLDAMGVHILGTSADSIDAAENRERFDDVMNRLRIKRPEGAGVYTLPDALKTAERLGYPVLVRPSYVLGGQNMIIAFEPEEIVRNMNIILAGGIDSPILIDKYLMGTEVEVDATATARTPDPRHHGACGAGGRALGDSIAVYPAWNLTRPGHPAADRLHAHAGAGAQHPRPHQHPVRDLRKRGLRHRSQPPRLPHDPLHQQGHGSAGGGHRHLRDAGRKASGHGLRRRALPPVGVLRGQGAGVLL